MADGSNLTAKSDSQIKALIDNHQRKGETSKPLYFAALEERARRQGFDLDRSKRIIEAAARERRFVSYSDLAEGNGVPWSRAYTQLSSHLWDLVNWGHGRGLPMLTAGVVTKENVGSGSMDESTLAGFVRAAEALGYKVDDAEAFLKQQQQALFELFAAEEHGA